jgi:hypothetical protein
MPVFRGRGHLSDRRARETVVAISAMVSAVRSAPLPSFGLDPTRRNLAVKPSVLSRKMSASFQFLMLHSMGLLRHHHSKPPF